jgi:D-3-phosphoglycerate dehydrogenase
MNDPVDALVLDLLESVGSERSYRELIEVWKTSCPRLPVWEEANARGYLEHHAEPGQPTMVKVSAKGRYALNQARRRTV